MNLGHPPQVNLGHQSTINQLKGLQQNTLKVVNSNNNKKDIYEGENGKFYDKNGLLIGGCSKIPDNLKTYNNISQAKNIPSQSLPPKNFNLQAENPKNKPQDKSFNPICQTGKKNRKNNLTVAQQIDQIKTNSPPKKKLCLPNTKNYQNPQNFFNQKGFFPETNPNQQTQSNNTQIPTLQHWQQLNQNRHNQQLYQSHKQQQQQQKAQYFQDQQQGKIPSGKNAKDSQKRPSLPPSIKDGDWLCPNKGCSNINWAKRMQCHLCGTDRPNMTDDMIVRKKKERMPAMVSKLYKSTLWSCSNCQNIVKAEFHWCCICGQKRSEEADRNINQAQKHINNTNGYNAIQGQQVPGKSDSNKENNSQFMNLQFNEELVKDNNKNDMGNNGKVKPQVNQQSH